MQLHHFMNLIVSSSLDLDRSNPGINPISWIRRELRQEPIFRGATDWQRMMVGVAEVRITVAQTVSSQCLIGKRIQQVRGKAWLRKFHAEGGST